MISSSKVPFGLPEQPSNPLAQDFDYAALDAETQIVVQQRTHEIKSLMRRTASDIFEIGQKLIEVKEQLGHGKFRDWLKAEFEWSISAATKFMQVSEQFKCVNFTQLKIAASALYLLAAPSTPEKARQEALEQASQGEAITHTKAQMIVTRHKQIANRKGTKPVTVDVPAETVERELTPLAELESAQHTKQNQLSIAEVVENTPASANQSEQELLRKEVETEPPLSEVSKADQTVQGGGLVKPTSIEDQEAKQMERQSISVNEICKSLIANLEYLDQEDIIEVIDDVSLASLMKKLTIFFKRTEASLNKRCGSSYFNN